MAHKENSFNDFMAAREELIEQGVSDSQRIVAYGASAGGYWWALVSIAPLKRSAPPY
ncbi:hypothetical protein HSBAA_41480 [Vreelandella sulfidaeris]|uniref:Peptidase S9 prolyl oligopeptidase catalytic domain-containing protein n=1 Tax=Vreelandella sulfidaeris TaxID=115553 RepID=A0A455U9H8_9GAMM|nr:hypothetical protein HSBAA_41480 [Halomonas sulfidaeris]